MDREKKQLKKQLAKLKEAIPSRAKLCLESMFGTTEAERKAAQALLDALPKEVRTRDEEVAWTTECWLTTRLPCDEDMEKSPIGRATLELFRYNQALKGDGVQPADGVSAPDAHEHMVSNAAMPEIPDDGINEHLKALNWPPPPTPKPPQVEDEPRRDSVWPKYTQIKPSPPDKSLRPISDEEFSNNSPIY